MSNKYDSMRDAINDEGLKEAVISLEDGDVDRVYMAEVLVQLKRDHLVSKNAMKEFLDLLLERMSIQEVLKYMFESLSVDEQFNQNQQEILRLYRRRMNCVNN